MRYLYYIVSVIFLTAAAYGQSPISAKLSAQRVTVNEIFHIAISTNGSDVKQPDLTAVARAGFSVGTPSQQSSTSIRTINGKTTVVQSRTWRYPLSLPKEGTFTIPRIPVIVDSKQYFTPPLTIQVTRTVTMGSKSSNSTTKLNIEDLAFVRATTDKKVVYQGQTILLRLRLYSIDKNYVRVESSRTLPLPETEGFYSGEQWQQNLNEEFEGRPYRITEINQILYPAMPGEQLIGAWQWQGVVRWYNSNRRPQTSARMFTTDPIKITVLPLPPQPQHFSGAVGRFNMGTHLSNDKLVQGKPVRLIVTISGKGNPNTISAPLLPDMPWAHISDPEVETRQQEDKSATTKLFSYLLTPLEAGEQVIPPVEFTFFAPLLKNYKTERSNEKTVSVEPSEEGNTFVAIGGSAEEQRRKIDIYDGDMLPIITDVQAVSTQSRVNTQHLGFPALLSPLFPVLLLIALQIFIQQHHRLSRDSGYARRYYAQTTCRQTLAAVVHAEDPTETLYRAITSFIGNMLDINEAGMTSAEAEMVLRSQNIPEELIAAVSRMLHRCERARYAGTAASDEDMAGLCTDAQELVDALYEVLKEKQS